MRVKLRPFKTNWVNAPFLVFSLRFWCTSRIGGVVFPWQAYGFLMTLFDDMVSALSSPFSLV